MEVSRYVQPVDLGSLAPHLRRPMSLLALTLLAPLFVAIVSGEWREAFVFAVLCGATYLVPRLLGSRDLPAISRRDALVLAACLYLLYSIVGAVAYLPVAPFVDGFFESMSGFTTTGLSLIDVERLPRSLLFFRSFSQWIGGAGIVVLAIVFLAGPRSTLLNLHAAEFKEENLLGNIVATSRLVFITYGALTALGFVAFLACGMGAFDALLHVLSTLSTGGFSTHPDSIGHYPGAPVRLAMCVFMLSGAVTFPIYYRARQDGVRRSLQDPQLRALLLLVALAFASSLLYGREASENAAVGEYAFHAISAVTTTGFDVASPASWPDGFRMLATLLMFIGGSAGSTAGGIKVIRLLILVQTVRWLLKRAVLPQEAELPIRLGDRTLASDELRAVLGFLALYLAFIVSSSLLLALGGFAPMDALFESVSALGTVGLSSGITSAGLPTWAKLVLVLDMWAGRLELLPLVVLFYPHTWFRRERSR